MIMRPASELTGRPWLWWERGKMRLHDEQRCVRVTDVRDVGDVGNFGDHEMLEMLEIHSGGQ